MSIIKYTLPLFIFQFLALVFFAQETESKNRIDFFAEINCSHSFNTNHQYGAYGIYGDNYTSLTDKGSSVQSANSTLGIEWRKWRLGGKLGFHKIINDLDYVTFSPDYPLVKRDFNYQQHLFSAGMSIERLIYLNKNSFLSLSVSISPSFELDTAFEEKTFEYYNNVNQETEEMISESFVRLVKYPLLDLSIKLFSTTKIGDFGFGINFLKLPQRAATGNIYQIRDYLDPPLRLRFGFRGIYLPEYYIGFSIAYQWKKRK
jgi:hypothetical protein